MKIFVGELDLEVREMLFEAGDEWVIGAGHKFTVEGNDFGAIVVPAFHVVILIHFESGVHLTTITAPDSVKDFDQMVQFIQTDVMVPTVQQFEDRGVEAVEAEFVLFEKATLDRIGPKPDIELKVIQPYQKPENLN